MKKTCLPLSPLAVFALAIPAHASTITISLVNPNQGGSVGQTLQFFGVITNDTNQTVNLDGDSLILTAPGITLIDDFNANVPFFLTPDGTTGRPRELSSSSTSHSPPVLPARTSAPMTSPSTPAALPPMPRPPSPSPKPLSPPRSSSCSAACRRHSRWCAACAAKHTSTPSHPHRSTRVGFSF